MPRRWRPLPIALCVAAILLLCGAIFRGGMPRPLSPLEARLVGTWTSNLAGTTRIFDADRSFATASGQYEGTWSINGGRLTIEYWQPFRVRDAYRGVFFHEVQKIGKSYTATWEIEFGHDDLIHALTIPERGDRASEKWEWRRVAEK